jgi:hypothetical protein
MPLYLFQHPKTKKVVEVVQRISEPHEYSEGGVKFNRVFTVPNASTDTKIDAFSEKDFARKTGNKKGCLGDLFDQAKEASEKRKKVLGKDPVEEKFWKNWSKKRGGRKPPRQGPSEILV